jgi:hypothetical protein
MMTAAIGWTNHPKIAAIKYNNVPRIGRLNWIANIPAGTLGIVMDVPEHRQPRSRHHSSNHRIELHRCLLVGQVAVSKCARQHSGWEWNQ